MKLRDIRATFAEAESERCHDALVKHFAKFCAPIGWLPRIDAPAASFKYKTGTCAFVDTGAVRAIITCEHVWTQWTRYKAKHVHAELFVGLGTGIPLRLSTAELLDCDKDLDLAVVKVEFDPQLLQAKDFWRIEEWPIPQPKAGDSLAIVGFPGTGRKASRGRITTWIGTFLGLTVSGVSSRQITLAPERNDRRFRDENGNEKPHRDIGGMSGSPAFLLRIHGPPQLVGFVKEGKTSDDFIFLTPALYLQQNGTLHE